MADYNEVIKNLQTVHGMPMTIRLAIEALEKQIPKQTKDKFTVPYDTLACGICPYCGEGVNSDMKFCSECGQRLNWSNDEET